MDHLGWIDDLLQRGKLSLAVRQDIAHMLRSVIPSVRVQGLVFCNRMKQQNPELWAAYQAKQRVLGLSSSNPTHK